MSLKGKTFTVEDLPFGARRKMTPGQIEKYCADQTERYAIIAMDGNVPLIAEELEQRALNKLTPRARRVCGMMIRLDEATRREIINNFSEDGGLKKPFSRP